ncbi:alphaketoglutarate/malate carrier [Pelomyxa schiedti]|nr:alphaketoglutarate/malate carrier [Pelomyxa schiedti]
MSSRSAVVPFVVGGVAASMSAFLVHPFDVVKVMMQLSRRQQGHSQQPPNQQTRNHGTQPAECDGKQCKRGVTMVSCMNDLVRTRGVSALYKGAGAAVVRQLVFGTTRLGMYNVIARSFAAHAGVTESALSLKYRISAAALSGGIAGLISTPIDLAVVRISSDARLPADQRNNYQGLMPTLCKIVRQEGAVKLFTGAIPTTARAIALQTSQVVVYAQVKKSLSTLLKSPRREPMAIQIASSFVSALVCSAITLPFDTIKTRMQASPPRGTHPPRMTECTHKLLSEGGSKAFWRGMSAYSARQAPHTVMTLFFVERLNAMCKKFF